jgi:hypothetical protein
MFLFPDVWASVCMVAPHSEQVCTYKRTRFQTYTATFLDVGRGYLLLIPYGWSTSYSLVRLGDTNSDGGASDAGGGELAGAGPGARAGLTGCRSKTCRLRSTSRVVVAIVVVVTVAAVGARRRSTSRGGGARV